MTTEQVADIQPGDLAQIVQAVFDTSMKLESFEMQTPEEMKASHLVASVDLTGDWNGRVLVECDGPRACAFAGHFLDIPTPLAVDDVVRDVLGELANVIGGNLKSMLARGVRLSLPTVTDSVEGGFQSGIIARLGFRSVEGPFWVSVLDKPGG